MIDNKMTSEIELKRLQDEDRVRAEEQKEKDRKNGLARNQICEIAEHIYVSLVGYIDPDDMMDDDDGIAREGLVKYFDACCSIAVEGAVRFGRNVLGLPCHVEQKRPEQPKGSQGVSPDPAAPEEDLPWVGGDTSEAVTVTSTEPDENP